MRIGQGYDIHRLEKGRPFILGGITVPFEKGPMGYSDGDPLLHAITDAILGALALGDIGRHFPDTDPENRDRNSGYFLKEAAGMVAKNGFKIGNIDATVILQAPKLSEHIPAICRQIASLLEIATDQVSVKAKTNEKLDAVGVGGGIAVHAVVLLLSS